MTQFEIYTKEVTVKNGEVTEVLKLRPLTGRFLPKLYGLVSKFEAQKEGEVVDDSQFKKLLTDETFLSDVYTLILETLKRSYPDAKQENLEDYTTRNLFQLLNVVIELNIPKA